MNTTVERLKSELTALSVEHRAELAHFLIQTLNTEGDAEVDQAWEDEVNRRLDQIKSGNARGIPADQVFARLKAKYS